MKKVFSDFTQAGGKTQKIIGKLCTHLSLHNDCVLCKSSTQSTQLLCRVCKQDLDIFPLGYDLLFHNPSASKNIIHDNLNGILVVSEYHWPFDVVLPQLKFHQNTVHAKWLAHLLSQHLPHINWPPIDIIFPIPLHNERLSQRGYNQAELLCRFLSVNTYIRYDLIRVNATNPQSELGRRERMRNIKGAFQCNINLSGKNVLIVDDVLTTGSTLDEAARAVKKSGAKAVFAAAIAIRTLN